MSLAAVASFKGKQQHELRLPVWLASTNSAASADFLLMHLLAPDIEAVQPAQKLDLCHTHLASLLLSSFLLAQKLLNQKMTSKIGA